MKKDSIKTLFKRLSNINIDIEDEFVLTPNQFNSIQLDKFISELKNIGISWNGNSISLKNLSDNIKTDIDNFDNTTRQEGRKTIFNDNINNSNIINIGIDLQLIDDMPFCKDYWDDSFYNDKFTKSEIAYCLNKSNNRQSFAGIYATKEALIKCNNSISWEDIEIKHDLQGRPIFYDYAISISHSGNYVVSVAIKYSFLEPPLSLVNHIPSISDKIVNYKKNYSNKFIIVYLFLLTILTTLLILHKI
jgi:holo-[acyl-carrier protein] synthase